MPKTEVQMIVGPPGAGKTTWIKGQVEKLVAEHHTHFGSLPGSPAVVCSLTKAAAAEAAGRVADKLGKQNIGTVHSMAFNALGLKKDQVLLHHMAEFGRQYPRWRLSESGDDADELYGETKADADDDAIFQAYQRNRAVCLPRDQWGKLVLKLAEDLEKFKADMGEVFDFNDMLEVCARDNVSLPQEPRALIVDEVQDASRLMLNTLRVWGKHCGDLRLVGDPYQALYLWCGAYPEMFTSEKVHDDHRTVLGQSYRVPRTVHAAAIRWISQMPGYVPFDYLPRDAEGSVHRCTSDWRSPESMLRHIEADLSDGKSVMVQASCRYMIGPLVAILKRRAWPFANPWRRKAGDWNPLYRPPSRSHAADRLLAVLAVDAHSNGGTPRVWTHKDAWLMVEHLDKSHLVHGAKTWAKQAAKDAPDSPIDGLTLGSWLTTEAAQRLDVMCQAMWDSENDSPAKEAMSWLHRSCEGKYQRVMDYALRVATGRGVKVIMPDVHPRLYVGTFNSFKGSEADSVYIFPDLSPKGAEEWDGGNRRPGYMSGYVAMTRAKSKLTFCDPAYNDYLPMRNCLT